MRTLRETITTWLGALALAAVAAVPAGAAAGEPVKGVWLAASTGDSTQDGRPMVGRLSVIDGMLTFHAPKGEWRVPLAEITRIALVDGRPQRFEVAASDGARLQLEILGPQLLTESPRKAMQVIQRAVREAARPATPTAAGSGGSSLR